MKEPYHVGELGRRPLIRGGELWNLIRGGKIRGTYQGAENTLSREHKRITKDIAKYMN